MSPVRICFVPLIIVFLIFPIAAVNAQTSVQVDCGGYRMDLSGQVSLPIAGGTISERLVLEKMDKSGDVEGKWKIVDWHYRQTGPVSHLQFFRKYFEPGLSGPLIIGEVGKGDWMKCLSQVSYPSSNEVIWEIKFTEGNYEFDVWENKIGEKASNYIAGTISGNTAKFRWQVLSPSSPELTGPVTLKKGEQTIRVSILLPTQEKRFSFDESKPGKFNIFAEAQVTPTHYANQLVWSVEKIEGTNITFDPLDAHGTKVNIKFEGLPDQNNQFGPHRINARLDVDGCVAEATVTVKIFYPLTAKNNPEGKYPNWFYYWKQTPAARPSGQIINIEYGGRTFDKCSDPECPAFFNRGYGYKTIYLCDLEKLKPKFVYNYPLLDRKTEKKYFGTRKTTFIDIFAVLVIHEFQHFLFDHAWREGKSPEELTDTDDDGIPDYLEEGMGFDPKKHQTFFGNHPKLKKIGGDEEWLCYEAMFSYQPGTYDKYDWAYPGRQWQQ